MSFKAIDTKYNGYKFRSRLEARWAVFFDQLNVRYLYEPEGFDLDGTWYLPDFFLSEGVNLVGSAERLKNVWIEIKPNLDLSDQEKQKAASFTKHTGYELLLIAGDPGPSATLSLIIYSESKGWRIQEVCWVYSGNGGLELAPNSLVESSDDRDPRQQLRNMARADLLINAYSAAREERFQKEKNTTRYCIKCGRQFRPYRDYHYLCRSCYRKKEQGKSDSRLYRSINVNNKSSRSTQAPIGPNPAVLGIGLIIFVVIFMCIILPLLLS